MFQYLELVEIKIYIVKERCSHIVSGGHSVCDLEFINHGTI
jgi:hypothetical protein